MLTPFVWAQNNPVTLGLTPMQPQVVLVKNQSSGDTGSFTAGPGSVTFTVGSATGTLSVKGPETLTGTHVGLQFRLSSPAVFTMSHTLAGFSFVRATLSDAQSFGGICQVSNTLKTDTCNVKAFTEEQEIFTPGGSYVEPGVFLIANVELDVGNVTAVYELHFQWAVGPPSPAISTMDIVQETTYNPAYQDTKTVPVIADKPTLARVYAISPLMTKDATALLHASRGTSAAELPGSPLKPLSGPLPIRSSFMLPKQVNRNDISQSFNFLLPPDWIRAGDLTLKAELQLPQGVQADPAKTTFTETVTFIIGSPSLEIAYIPFCYQSKSDCASSSVADYHDVIRKLYPINPANVHYFRLFTPFNPWMTPISNGIWFDDGGFLAFLEKIYHWTNGRTIDQLAGWLPRIPRAAPVVGVSDPAFFPNFGAAHVFMGLESGTLRYISETLAHEIGHNLGLHHTDLSAICNDSDPSTSWPYPTPWSQEAGFDFTNTTLLAPSLGDLMSYCDPNGISPFDVRELLKNPLLRPFPGATPRQERPRAGAAAATGEQILIGGWAQRDASAGSLDPLYRIPADGTAPPSIDGGSHCLRFSGAAGALGDYCFQLGFRGVESSGLMDRQYFTLVAPLPAGATRVALMAGTKELASLTASSAAPALTITSPQTGDIWNGGTGTIAWSASDPDNRPVSFTVLYSYDGGQSWIPMAIDIGDSQFSFDSSAIMGGSNVMFRVFATDGMNSTSTDVGPIQVNQTPTLMAAASLDFGAAVTGDAPVKTLSVSNPGSGPLMLNSYSIDTPGFTVVSAAPLAIGAGETASLSIQWMPPSTGAQAATLTLNSNDPANPNVTVRLSGTAAAASGCTFGLSPNAGPAGAAGGDVTVIVSASADTCTWTAARNVPWITVKAGAGGTGDGEVAFTVAANTAASARTGTVTIAGLTYTVTQAAAPPAVAAPSISVSTNALNFGAVTLGQPPGTMKFTIGNTGNADLHVQSITQTGDPSFSLTPKFAPVTLAAGKSIDITVQFAPTVAGALSGTLSISSDDPDPTRNALKVSLAGTANPAPAGGACVPPASNLVSWWTGDGTVNDSTGGNNLALQGGATFAAGEAGQAFQFDGSSGYASAGNPANLRLTSAVTVEAWINPRSAPAVGNMAAILTKWAQIFDDTPVSDSYGLWIRQETGGLNLFGAIHQSGGSEPHVQGGTIPLNAWTHVAMTFDSTSGQFTGYVNGQAVSTLTSPGPMITSSRNVFIGREDSSQPRPFNGLIDEVAVYGRALSASEVQGIFAAGAAGKCKPATGGGTLVPTPASLDFGSTSTPVTKTLTLRNTGASAITIGAAPITPAASPFTLVTPLPFTVPGNGQLDLSVRFAPTAAGAQTAALAIGSLSIPLSGTGLSFATTTTLTVDSNTFATSIGLPPGAVDNYFVNRLTPPAYPATLRKVQIVFGTGSAALPAGWTIRVVSGSNSSGNAGINGITLTKTVAQVTPGQTNSFDVPPITIASGDFVVGFETGYPAGVFPAVVDTAPPLRLRSYFSVDGATFTVLDASSGVPGNLGIRAVVDVGATTAR